MLINEYRIVMPLSLQEYEVAQLYNVLETSKAVTGGGQGVEIVQNEPFSDQPLLGDRYSSGQYTFKKYHLESKIPWWIRQILPVGMTKVHEEAWNAFPYCRTVLTNPEYMNDNFLIKIESLHLPDRGLSENVHCLKEEELSQRQVITINIAEPAPKGNKSEYDPRTFKSTKTGRGPLYGEWQSNCEPCMCCYKLVSVKFVWFGLQSQVESYLQKQYRCLFHTFNRQVFCTMDKWYGITIEEIRAMETKVQEELNKKRDKGEIPDYGPMDE